MARRLYLGREKMIAGVCSGIADYFGWDPTLVRLLWVIFGLTAGSGVLAYIIAMFIIPQRPDAVDEL